MSTFLSIKKVYQIGISAEERLYLSEIRKSKPAATTLIFLDILEDQERRELLFKMMEAVACKEQDFILVDRSKHPHLRMRNFSGESFPHLRKILCFGVAPQLVGLNVASLPYKPLNINGYTSLLSDSLTKLVGDTTLKRTLWAGMKEMFV